MRKLDFNDNWQYGGRVITLPHDAMIEAERDAQNPSGSAGAYFPGGVYEYTKSFTAPKEWEQKTVLLQFEGVYQKACVFLNGKELGGAAYGYIPFFVELTGLTYGGENLLKVTADNAGQPNSRWYTGGGIYRPVWLWECEKEGLRPEQIKVTTLSYSPAMIRVESADKAAVEIIDGDRVIASGSGSPLELELSDVTLWSEDTPKLYDCRVRLGQDDTTVKFGIRKVEWSPKGLFINGKETLLRGGCIHHDNGILGAATHRESEYRRAEKLKKAGYNALRISHNPASEAMLSACDELGLYVMDETWDMWYNHKSKYDYASDFLSHYKADIAAMVRRDYNHPSVILYSMGNEVSEPAKEKGVALADEMAALFRTLDPTRPVSAGLNLMIISNAAKGKSVYKEEGGRDESGDKKMAGMNSTLFNMMTQIVGTGMNKSANSDKADKATSPVLSKLDICGYNYASGRYEKEGEKHPERLIFGSETFPQDIAKNWAMVKKHPYIIGDFMWTAWDYLGEAGLGAWAYTADGKGFNKPYPWLLADTGAMDILGDPNGELFWAQAVWGLLKAPAIAVQPPNHDIKPAKGVWRGTNAIPSWSWRGCEGKKAIVEVYFDCAKVALYLNGVKCGTQKVKDCRAVIKTKYAPGKLEAVCYDSGGKEIGRSALNTAGAADIHINPEKSAASPGELVYIPVTIGDGQNTECNADRTLTVSVTGGELLAFGSANPRTEERFASGSYTTYYGRAMAALRMGKAEKAVITATDSKCKVSTEILVK